jgi:hypothetical protein
MHTRKPSLDLRALAPDLAPKTAVRLHPRPGRALAARSKLGGVLAWQTAEAWPSCAEHGAPRVGVLQLAREDLPEIPFPPGADLFQLFWCAMPHAFHAPGPLACWGAAASLVELRPDAPAPAPDALREWVPKECVFAPERVVEYPSAFELPPERVAALDALIAEHAAQELDMLGIENDASLYQYHFSVAPGTKVGGYVHWMQDPDVPKCAAGHAMDHLLTVASLEFDGAWQRWLPEEDLAIWSRPYAERKLVQSPTGLTFGDAGSYYIFTCPRCAERPIAAVHQSS